MLSTLTFKTGASAQSAGLVLQPSPITVFVGPNNSGKSQILVEIESWSKEGFCNPQHVLENVQFARLSEAEIDREIDTFATSERHSQGPHYRTFRSVSGYDALQIDTAVLKLNILHNPTAYGQNTYPNLRRFYTLRLDGQTRLNLLSEVQAGDLQNPFTSSAIAKLFRDYPLRLRVRKIIHDSIGEYFVIDPTNSGQFRVRFSNRPPNNEAEECSLTGETIRFHAAAKLIQQVSDGIKAFAGIITTLIAGSPKIILIDEPEAFLHPALAMKLGKEIASSINSDQRLFIATHSASFIMGCIQSGAPINIVRVTYKGGVGTTRILERDKLLPLMRNPMLRSTGVLDGLFYEAVIVTEADADRAFYQEINERLRTANDSRGIQNCLFINAQNKQTVWDIVKPLRELGIPAVGIVDLDMVKDGGTNFGKLLKSNFIPHMQEQPLGHHREAIKHALDATAPAITLIDNPESDNPERDNEKKSNYWKRNGGIDLLSPSDKQSANNFFDQLDQYGIFVVRIGELEDWLKYLEVPKGNKGKWLPNMFVKMGEDPSGVDYVIPSSGDAWDFIGNIKSWIANPNRLGIPD